MRCDRRTLARWALAAGLALGPAREALAQGCALCRLSAAQSGGNPGAFNTAILVLLLPTLGIFLGILCRAFRQR